MTTGRVDFEKLVECAELIGGDTMSLVEVLVYKPTGAVHLHGDAIDEEAEDYPEDPETSDQYLALPSKQEFGLGKPLALRYARERLSAEGCDRVAEFFSRRGAYGRFKDFLDRQDLLDDWHDYEAAAVREAVRE